MPNNQIMSMEGQLCGMPLAGPESFSQQQLEYLKRALGVDETVLFDGALPARTNTITLSEPFSNFEFVDVTYGGTNLGENPITFRYMTKYCGAQQVSFKISWSYNYIHEAWIRFTSTADNKVWTYASNTVVEIKNSGTAAPSVVQNDTSYITSSRGFKIVGIHRIAGGNT